MSIKFRTYRFCPDKISNVYISFNSHFILGRPRHRVLPYGESTGIHCQVILIEIILTKNDILGHLE